MPGPIYGGDVVLKSHAQVVGDIHHQALTIGKGAYFKGRSVQEQRADGGQADRPSKEVPRSKREKQPRS